MSKELTELSCEKSLYDEIRITSFRIDDIVAVPPSLGRCFIEVTSADSPSPSRCPSKASDCR